MELNEKTTTLKDAIANQKATSFALEMLEKTGVAVSLDKEEFNRILNGTEKLQKMVADLEEFKKLKAELDSLQAKHAELLKEQEKVEADRKQKDKEITKSNLQDFFQTVKELDKFIDDEVLIKINAKICEEPGGDHLKIWRGNDFILYVNEYNDEIPDYSIYDDAKLNEIIDELVEYSLVNRNGSLTKFLEDTVYENLQEKINLQKRENSEVENTILVDRNVVDLTPEESERVKKTLKKMPYVEINGVNVFEGKINSVTEEIFLKELVQSKILVDNDHEVYLLPEHYTTAQSAADTLTDNEFLDLKTVTGGKSKVGKRFAQGKEQARDVFVRVKSDITAKEAITSIQDQFKNIRPDMIDGRLILMLDKANQYFEMNIKKDGTMNIIPTSQAYKPSVQNDIAPSVSESISQKNDLSSKRNESSENKVSNTDKKLAETEKNESVIPGITKEPVNGTYAVNEYDFRDRIESAITSDEKIGEKYRATFDLDDKLNVKGLDDIRVEMLQRLMESVGNGERSVSKEEVVNIADGMLNSDGYAQRAHKAKQWEFVEKADFVDPMRVAAMDTLGLDKAIEIFGTLDEPKEVSWELREELRSLGATLKLESRNVTKMEVENIQELAEKVTSAKEQVEIGPKVAEKTQAENLEEIIENAAKRRDEKKLAETMAKEENETFETNFVEAVKSLNIEQEQTPKIQFMKNIPFSKLDLGKVADWQVEEAKEAGIDLSGYKHEITNQFIAHVVKNHGNAISEAARGNVAITKDDLKKLGEVISNPDRVVYGTTRKEFIGGKMVDQQRVIYVKESEKGTNLYFEAVLEGNKNKTLRGKTFFKKNGELTNEALENVISINSAKSNVENIKIAVHEGATISPFRSTETVDVAVNSTSHEQPSNESIAQFVEKSINEYASTKVDTEAYIKENTVYGFTYGNKIYLNADALNSNAPVHEYTHLWDKAIEKTNPALWKRGVELLKTTTMWNEIKNSPAYADIADDENLLASEVHARLSGNRAEQCFTQIAREDGEITEEKTRRWNGDAWEYVIDTFTDYEIDADKKIETLKSLLKEAESQLPIAEKELAEKGAFVNLKESDLEILKELGVPEKNLNQIDDALEFIKFKDENGKEISKETVEERFGKEKFLAGIATSAFVHSYQPIITDTSTFVHDSFMETGFQIMKNDPAKAKHIVEFDASKYFDRNRDEQPTNRAMLVRSLKYEVQELKDAIVELEKSKSLENITLEQFLAMPMKDFIQGVNPAAEMGKSGVEETIEATVQKMAETERDKTIGTNLDRMTYEDFIQSEFVREKTRLIYEKLNFPMITKIDFEQAFSDTKEFFSDSLEKENGYTPEDFYIKQIILQGIDSRYENLDKIEFSDMYKIADDILREKLLNKDEFEVRMNAIHAVKKEKEKMVFEEQETGRFLLVEETDNEFEFNSRLYDVELNLVSEKKIGTVFDDKRNIPELTKACDGAMEFHGIDKTDVMIFEEERFEEMLLMRNSAQKITKSAGNGIQQNEDSILGTSSGSSDEKSKISKARKISKAIDPEQPYKNSVSEKQFSGNWIPFHNAKIIKESMNKGNAPFLPNEEGEITARPIYNANTGFCLYAKDLIPLQIVADGNFSLSSAVVATKNSINAAKTSVKAGEKGFFYNFKRDDGSIGTTQFFFSEQTENPEAVKKLAEGKIRKSNNFNKTVEITSAEPEEYLANYVAACKIGAKMKVSSEIAEEFKKSFSQVLDNQFAKKDEFDKKIGKLNELFFNADRKSAQIVKDIERQNEISNAKQKMQAVAMER
ncbi:MAG: hypothetical protein NC041_06990 [Bacteroides sp.]|nr:hypothetical protein [Prevotella sp.]MCM1407042.1 hypothetical protein [Treponema brennaborense]MCM1470194.1 hypothetical protein [Bacteroides sp.]